MAEDKAALMACHADALFRWNDDGNMTGVNDLSGAGAPAVYWGITQDSTIVRYRHDVPVEIRREVDALLMNASGAWEDCFVVLRHLSIRLATRGLHIASVWSGPVFIFPEDLPPFHESVLVMSRNAALLTAEFPEHAKDIEVIQPCLAVVRDGRAVAVCCTARTGRCVDAGVETAAGFRRMGLGIAVCTEWARNVRKLGFIPIYSTSWDNVASRRLAQRLSLQWIGIDVHFQLVTPT